MTFNVGSEVGQLREAIVHRPGLELSRLTPDNIEGLLFDDVMWASKAQEEHDAFTQALRDKGVLVHHYGILLAETLDLPDGRAFVLDRVCTPEILGPSLVEPVRRLFEDLDGRQIQMPHLRQFERGERGKARERLEVVHAEQAAEGQLRQQHEAFDAVEPAQTVETVEPQGAQTAQARQGAQVASGVHAAEVEHA